MKIKMQILIDLKVTQASDRAGRKIEMPTKLPDCSRSRTVMQES
jgi:hypothetical protein